MPLGGTLFAPPAGIFMWNVVVIHSYSDTWDEALEEKKPRVSHTQSLCGRNTHPQ